MANIKQIGMAAGTFSVALGIGFVMQNGDALASRFGAESAPAQPAPFTQTEQLEDVSLEQPLLEGAVMVEVDVEAPIVTRQRFPLILKLTRHPSLSLTACRK